MRNMISFSILAAYLLTLLVMSHGVMAFKSWTYNLLEMDSNSSNPDLFRIDVKLVRVGRGDYAISGELDFAFPADDSFEVEVLVFRSPDGSAEYKLQPIVVPRQSFLKAMDNYYKTLIMSSVKSCSNLPQYEDNLTQLGPMLYKMDKCKISNEAFPSYVPEGYYKLYFSGVGPVEFMWYLLVQIEKRVG